jgi:hypothetical protein
MTASAKPSQLYFMMWASRARHYSATLLFPNGISMRNGLLTVYFLLAANVLFPSVHVASASAQEGGSTNASSGAAVQATFVSLIRKVADSGRLDDPSAIEVIVGLKFAKSVTETRFLPTGCKKDKFGIPERLIVNSYSVQGHNWYHGSPAGTPNMAFPSFTINPAGVVGSPEIDYKSYRSIECTDSSNVGNLEESHLEFNNLSTYLCLTPGRIQTLLPEARFQQATDGVSFITYQGAQDDDAGTTVKFGYRFGASCALDATIEQTQKAGLRYKRVVFKHDQCSGPVIRDYCSAHPQVQWGDEMMEAQVDRDCGTLNELYQKEPPTGKIPGEIKFVRRSNPCENR